MMSKIIKKINSNKVKLLEELFENSYFDDNSYEVFEDSVEAYLGKTKDNKDSLKELCFELATVRNRNLINAAEQKKLRAITVGFFGLSVGSHAALTWIMESRADNVKIIDFDTLSASNLNRLRFGWEDLDKKKVDVTEKYIQKISPFTNVLKETNVSEEVFEKIFDDKPKINFVVDAIDSMKGKIFLRKLAKARKLPLISAADVGDNVTLDVERYDLKPQPSFFLGKVPGIEKLDIDSLSKIEKNKLIIKLVGFEQLNEKMLDSLLDIGDSLATWPQLGGTATMTGGILTNTIKKIVLGEKVENGRYQISLDNILVKDHQSAKSVHARKRKILKLKKELGIS